eukprot:gene5676-8973_t
MFNQSSSRKDTLQAQNAGKTMLVAGVDLHLSLQVGYWLSIMQISHYDRKTNEETNKARFEEIQSSIQGSLLKKEHVSPFTEVRERIERTKEENDLHDIIEMQEDAMGIRLEFSSSHLYELGSAEIRNQMRGPLALIGQSIGDLHNVDYLVEVEGHTDDIPIRSGIYDSNWELSAHRATNVVRYFSENGIPQNRLRAVAYGESRPKVPNRDENGNPIAENQAENRRIVVHVRRVRLSD